MIPARAVTVVSALALLAYVGQGASADPTPPPPPQPATGCATFSDPSGDAYQQADLGGGVNVPSDPDVDLTGVTFASPPGKIRVYLQVLALATPVYGVGHIFEATFTFHGKTVRIYGGQDSPRDLEGAHDPSLLGGSMSGVTYDFVDVGSQPEVDFDPAHNLVILTADRAPIEKAAAADLADGSTITNLAARSSEDLLITTQTADTAAPATPGEAIYAMGDNHCFGQDAPVPAPAAPAPSPTPSPTASAPEASGSHLFALPRTGCAAFTDAAQDAAPTPAGNDPDLDVTAVNFKTDAGSLSAFVHVATLAASPALPFDGHRFALSFTLGGKAVGLSADQAGPAAATVAGATSPDLKPTAVFDITNSNVVFTVPLAGLTAAVGTAVEGAALTNATVTTAALVAEAGEAFPADSATGTKAEEKTYQIGDNRCFQPAPGILALDADPSGQYSDSVEVYAVLTDASEDPVAGAQVAFGFGGATLARDTTDADGVAHAFLPIRLKAGATTMKAVFAGSDGVGPATGSRSFKVLLEKTVLKAVGSKGTVTATLHDNDRKPVPGAYLVFRVGNKSTAVKTDSKGVARIGQLASGTVVSVSFPGTKGKYAAARATSARAL
jgi:hypothetical protein